MVDRNNCTNLLNNNTLKVNHFKTPSDTLLGGFRNKGTIRMQPSDSLVELPIFTIDSQGSLYHHPAGETGKTVSIQPRSLYTYISNKTLEQYQSKSDDVGSVSPAVFATRVRAFDNPVMSFKNEPIGKAITQPGKFKFYSQAPYKLGNNKQIDDSSSNSTGGDGLS